MWNPLRGSFAAQSISLADPALPPSRDFLTSAGFGGVAALVAAIILAAVLLFLGRNSRDHNTRQLDEIVHHHDAIRDDQKRSAALARAWERLQWVVTTAGLEPASSQGVTLGLGPELATEVLRGILAEADELGDAALGNAATVHLSQLSLVLSQQAGPLTAVASADGSAPKTDRPAKSAATTSSASPPTPANADDSGSATAPTTDSSSSAPAGSGRTRRRSS